MNILLLGLSTLPYRETLDAGDFLLDEDPSIVVKDCKPQQEPVIRLMLQQCPAKETAIILLCTEKSLKYGSELVLSDQRADVNVSYLKSIGKMLYEESVKDESGIIDKKGKLSSENDPLIAEGSAVPERLNQEVSKKASDYAINEYVSRRLSPYKDPVIESFTALEYLKLRTTRSIFQKDISWEYSEAENRHTLRLYDGERILTFYTIQVDELNPVRGIHETVRKVRALYNKGEDTFWLDTHGGLRDMIHISNSIISILREEGIVPEKIYGIEYNKAGNRILDVQNAFYIERFVNGIQDFLSYGRADILQDYYRNTRDEKIMNLLAAMQEISEGTQLCDPDCYRQGLEHLRQAIGSFNSSGEDEYIYIFKNLIEEDFKNLVTGSYSTLDIISRCYQKKLYQQALTFLETYMSAWYVEQGMVLYDTKSDPYLKLDAISSHVGFDYPVNRLIFKLNDRMTPLREIATEKEIVAFYASWTNADKKEEGLSNRERYRGKKNKLRTFIGDEGLELKLSFAVKIDDVKKNADKYEGLLAPVYQKMQEGNLEMIASKDTDCGLDGKPGTILLTTLVRNERMSNLAQDILVMHSALKRCRNKLNHADSKNRPSNKDIIAALGVYIKCCEDMKEYLSKSTYKLTNEEK